MSRYHVASEMCDDLILKEAGVKDAALWIARVTGMGLSAAAKVLKKLGIKAVKQLWVDISKMAKNKRMGKPLMSRLSKALLGMAVASGVAAASSLTLQISNLEAQSDWQSFTSQPAVASLLELGVGEADLQEMYELDKSLRNLEEDVSGIQRGIQQELQMSVLPECVVIGRRTHSQVRFGEAQDLTTEHALAERRGICIF